MGRGCLVAKVIFGAKYAVPARGPTAEEKTRFPMTMTAAAAKVSFMVTDFFLVKVVTGLG
jgi:hypothetical protein